MRVFSIQGPNAICTRFFCLTIPSSEVALRRISKICKCSPSWRKSEGHTGWRNGACSPGQPSEFYFSKNPSSGGVLSANHRGCVHSVNSGAKLRLIKGQRAIIRFSMMTKGWLTEPLLLYLVSMENGEKEVGHWSWGGLHHPTSGLGKLSPKKQGHPPTQLQR